MPNCPNCGKPYNPGDEVCPDCGLVFPFATEVLAPGTILQGRYEIQELTHTGGMGYIYLAKDKKLYDRLCIVKQVKEPVKSDSDLKKLEEEARRMAKLSHPNVAMILDHFVESGYYFLVVERISGKTLSEIFSERHGQLMEEEVVNWAISICDVISYIHEEGIIHRDISPDNIMLTEAGVIKFVDFGTLRELRYITTRGTAGMGKYGYTPPEQWQGKPTPQSDIFALGATIYYLLTGNLPLSKEYLTGQGPQRQDFSPNFPPIRQKNPEISTELEAVLQKALHLDVSNRYTSAAEFGQALRSLGKVEIFRREPVEAAKPVLSVDPERIGFADVRVGSRATRTLTVRNTGTGRLTGKITTSHPWIRVSPTRIDLETGEQTVLVTVDSRYLYPQISLEGWVSVATNGGMANVDVSFSTTGAAAKPEPIIAAAPKPKSRRSLVFYILVGLAGFVLLVMSVPNILHVFDREISSSPPILNIDSSPIYFDDLKIGLLEAASTSRSITNTGTKALRGILTVDRTGWLHVSPSNITLTNDTQFIKIWVDTMNLKPGHGDTGYITIKTNGGEKQIPVYITTRRVIFMDDFSNPNSGWTKASDEYVDYKYEGGEYHIVVKKPGFYWAQSSNANLGQLTDFALEVDARFLSAPGPDSGEYMVLFRFQKPGECYWFTIRPYYGTYAIRKFSPEYHVLKDWTYSDYINKGTSTNRLKVVCQGAEISVYVNGYYLTSLTDYSISKGDVQMAVWPSSYQGDVIFDNLEIYVPQLRRGSHTNTQMSPITISAPQSAVSALPVSVSQTQGIPVWRALLLVYHSIDVDYIDSSNTPRHMSYTMPEDQIAKAIQSFRQYTSFAYDYSNGEALVKYDIVHVTRPITSLTDRTSNNYWVSPSDTRQELNKYVLPGTYDSVFVFWPKIDFKTGQEIPSSGWGLAIGASEWSNGATYVTVHNANDLTWEEPTVGEVWLHEWLHGVCKYYQGKGYRMPTADADGGESHGYVHSSTIGWSSYLRDLMTGHVLDNGIYTGITAEAWRSGSITGSSLER